MRSLTAHRLSSVDVCSYRTHCASDECVLWPHAKCCLAMQRSISIAWMTCELMLDLKSEHTSMCTPLFPFLFPTSKTVPSLAVANKGGQEALVAGVEIRGFRQLCSIHLRSGIAPRISDKHYGSQYHFLQLREVRERSLSLTPKLLTGRRYGIIVPSCCSAPSSMGQIVKADQEE